MSRTKHCIVDMGIFHWVRDESHMSDWVKHKMSVCSVVACQQTWVRFVGSVNSRCVLLGQAADLDVFYLISQSTWVCFAASVCRHSCV